MRAISLSSSESRKLYGAGMARLDAIPPTLAVRIGRGARRLLRVRADDAGTIRDVRISLNGRPLRVVRRPVVGVRLPVLAGGVSTLVIRVEDMAGNVATRVRALRGPR